MRESELGNFKADIAADNGGQIFAFRYPTSGNHSLRILTIISIMLSKWTSDDTHFMQITSEGQLRDRQLYKIIYFLIKSMEL